MKDDFDDFNGPYLPARYRETVRKKKQRRLLKKIGMVAAAAVVVVVAYILLSGFFVPSPDQTHPSSPSPTPSPSLPQTVTTRTTYATSEITETQGVKSVPATMVMTYQPPGTLVTVTNTPEVFQTAMASTYKNLTQPAATITEKQAEAIARAAFPGLPAGNMSVELVTSPDFGLVWQYTLLAGTAVEASGLIDAETGTVVMFNRTIHPGGRSQNPVLTPGDARQIAESTINRQYNGILSINMSSASYVPLATTGGGAAAGSYRFVYNRIVDDYPCDADGFIVSVDAISGAITEYVQRWQTPDTAFNMAEEAIVPRHEALYIVQARAAAIYPSSASGFSLLSADIRWKDRHDPATIPRLSSIPLAWKIVFDDAAIRAKAGSVPAVAWVDAQTGELLEISYQH